MCVDKSLDDLKDFADLAQEAENMSQEWKIVFVACLDGKIGEKLTNDKVENSLKDMIKYIHQGMVSKFLAFDNEGELIKFT